MMKLVKILEQLVARLGSFKMDFDYVLPFLKKKFQETGMLAKSSENV
jgi:hypothetical protein